MKRFKELICQYPTAFLLPGSPLRAVKGFEHRMDTAYAPPIYSHPYKKSPELRAIKTEIKRMLKLKITQPSQSEWGSPCILVCEPPEKGKLQPPRFVVDYRRLNSCDPRRLPYPIHLKCSGCCQPRKSICKMWLSQWILANFHQTVRSTQNCILYTPVIVWISQASLPDWNQHQTPFSGFWILYLPTICTSGLLFTWMT